MNESQSGTGPPWGGAPFGGQVTGPVEARANPPRSISKPLAPAKASTPLAAASNTEPPLTKAERQARAEWIKSQAQKSPLDRYGNVRCLSCGKVLGSYEGLAGHLVSLHDGENSEERRAREASEAVNEGRNSQRPPVLLSDGLAPLLEALPGGKSNRSEGGLGGGRSGFGDSTWKGVLTEGKSPDNMRANENQVFAQSGEGQKGQVPNGQKKNVGDRQQGPGERVRVSLLAGHAAAAMSGEGHRPLTQGVDKDKRIVNPNTAQSTGLVERRGKEREQPKKKRLSKLKKVLLQEREIVAREGGEKENDAPGGASVKDGARAANQGAAGISVGDHSREGGSEAGLSEGGDLGRASLIADKRNCAETRVSGCKEDLETDGASVFEEGNGDGKSRTEGADQAAGLVGAQKGKQEPVTYIGPNVKIR